MNGLPPTAGATTITGKTVVAPSTPATANPPTPGVISGMLNYDAVKHLLVDRPLVSQPFRPLPPYAEGESIDAAADAEDLPSMEELERRLDAGAATASAKAVANGLRLIGRPQL